MAEPFDPYAYAVQWYMDHPEVLIDIERSIEDVLKRGVTLDELDEIEEKSFGFGKLVRESESNGNDSGRWSKVRHEWVKYKESLPQGTKTEAQEAYYRGYAQ